MSTRCRSALALWLLLLASALAMAQSDAGGPILENGPDGKPVLKFPAAHQHAMQACVGYLYVSATSVRFVSNTEPGHSFEKPKSDIAVAQEWRTLGVNMDALELKFKSGGTYHFFHLKGSAMAAGTHMVRTDESLSFQPMLDAVLHYDDVLARLAPPTPVVPAPVVGAPSAEASALFEKLLRARGGDKARSVYAYRRRFTRYYHDQKGDHTITCDDFVAVPDREHLECTTPEGTAVFVVTPADAFGIWQGQTQDMPANWAANSRAAERLSLYALARAFHDGRVTVSLGGNDVVSGTVVTALDITVGGVDTFRWFADPISGRVLRGGVTRLDDRGNRTYGTTDYSDYRLVDGIAMPFHLEGGVGGEHETVDTQGVELNPNVDPQLFYRKPLLLSQVAFTPAAAPPAPLVVTATLRITSQPTGAQVYVDDVLKGTTSDSEGRLVVENVAAGSHRMRMSATGYKEWTKTVDASAGDTIPIEAVLERAGPPPFSVADVEQMLQGGVSPKRAAALVKERGVDFAVDDTAEKRLRAAGADDSLLLAIARAKR